MIDSLSNKNVGKYFTSSDLSKKGYKPTLYSTEASCTLLFPFVIVAISPNLYSFPCIKAKILQLIPLIKDCLFCRSAIIEMEYTHKTKGNTHIGDFIEQTSKRNKDSAIQNVLSVSNSQGFIQQCEQFENRSVASDDISNYKIVERNCFAFNPARINVGSIGYQNIGKNVIVSSLYEVFKTSEDVDDRLLWHWFKSPDFQKLIMQLQEGGVRLYFYYDKLCMGEVSLPLLEEQRKIGKLFDTLDNLITLHQRQTIVYAVIRSIRKVILAERQYFAPPMVRKFP